MTKHMYKYTQNVHLNQWFNYKINFLLIVFDISSTCFFRYIDIIDTPNGVCMTVLHRTAVVTKHQFTGSKLLQIYVRALNFSSVHT